MEYFPFFMEIGRMKGIVIGGGKIALQKVKVLSQFDFALTILSPDVLEELYEMIKQCNQENSRKHPIIIRQKEFEEWDISPFDFVVAATNIPWLNKKISELAFNNNKLINVVDDKESCNFIFPSIVKQKDLVLGISTGGIIPYLSKRMREQLQASIPTYYGELLELLGEQRQEIKDMIGDIKERTKFYDGILQICNKNNRCMTLDEWAHYKGEFYENNTDWD